MRTNSTYRRPVRALVLLAAGFAASRAEAFEFFDGRLQIHGYGETQMRMLADDFHHENAVFSQWANILNLEFELGIAPEGIGPFDSITAFSRVLFRYDCIYTGCGVIPSWRYWGDRANRVPRNLADGRDNPFSGQLREPNPERERFHKSHELLSVYETPLLKALGDLNAPNLKATFDPVDEGLFAVKNYASSIGNGTFALGPWDPQARIDPSGSLDVVLNPTLPLPLRPAVGAARHGGLDPHGLFIPSEKYLDNFEEYDELEQNYSQTDLALHHVQSQDERELKELYVDLEAFEGRLWLRLGKQTIVWGKTELFRTTDQFNPQTLALSSLPSLEESRIALWSARGTWSFYDVGPLEDVRLELAANLDDFEPLDLGRCGTPYTVWLVCGKTFGYWAHGVAGAGLAGEDRPSDWWESPKGLEFGARMEFRWDRFSFQVSDFWGYDDAPTIDSFNEFERRVDPFTGRPVDIHGDPLDPSQDPGSILRNHPANRQLFDVVCSATVGIAEAAFPGLADRCLVDVVNSSFEVLPNVTVANSLTAILSGSGAGAGVLTVLTGGAAPPPIRLNRDPGDGAGSGPFGTQSLSAFLTDQQEALFGCGPFYGTSCDVDGVDLFNAEASVLLQGFPQFEPNGPVATRWVPGSGSVILPGARGPNDPGYNVLLDGCVAPGPIGCNAGDPGRVGPSANALIDPRTGALFRNELGAASYNFLLLVAGLGAASGTDPACDVADPFTCEFVRGVFAIAGMRRPEVRAGGNGDFGRRDFIWQGGSEIQLRYQKRNVLGAAADFAEDITKTNWSLEGTWIKGQTFGVSSEPHGYDRFDTWNLTVSVDRPTFINFLNPNRTFFFNAQVFFRYITDYVDDDRMSVHGPFSALWTLSAFTGYYQDRMLPGVTWVHDGFSSSGGIIGQLSYRFTESFTATFGVAAFYGKPDELQVPLRAPILANQGPSFKADTRYDGLSPIAERDEFFLQIRYTF
jgi:hypothetical protein